MKKEKFWNLLAKNYDDEVGEETAMLTKKYLRKSDTVLDYGCARGAYTIALAGEVKEIRGTEKVIQKIEEILKPSGRFISVTTCMKEGLLLRIAAFFIGLFGILHLRKLTTSELKKMISVRFDIVETKKFSPHHILIVAEKYGK